jgi:hypothetical protein
VSQNDSAATDAVDDKKIQELLEKDAKSGRRVTGPWLWLTSALGAAMVLLYFYGAGFQALGTQYHLGIYVLITFVLVFLLYPAGGRLALGFMAFGAALLLAVGASAFLIFDGPTAFYDQITALRETWEYDGLSKAMQSDLGQLRWVGVLTLPLFAVLLPLDQWLARRFHHAPTASDVIMAAVIAGAVLYWISQFAALNYRAGPRTRSTNSSVSSGWSCRSRCAAACWAGPSRSSAWP